MHQLDSVILLPLAGSAVCNWRLKWTFWWAELRREVRSTHWWMGSSARAEDQPLQCRSAPDGWVECLLSRWSSKVVFWLILSPLYEGVCSLNNKLYVVGGSDPCGQKGLKNCDAFDPVTKTWSNCASLNISKCPYSPIHSSKLLWKHNLERRAKIIVLTGSLWM